MKDKTDFIDQEEITSKFYGGLKLIDFSELLIVFEKELRASTSESLNGKFTQLLSDGSMFAIKIKSDIHRWTGMHSIGDITMDDFEFLIRSRSEYLIFERMNNSGFSESELITYKKTVIDSLIDSVRQLIN